MANRSPRTFGVGFPGQAPSSAGIDTSSVAAPARSCANAAASSRGSFVHAKKRTRHGSAHSVPRNVFSWSPAFTRTAYGANARAGAVPVGLGAKAGRGATRRGLDGGG